MKVSGLESVKIQVVNVEGGIHPRGDTPKDLQPKRGDTPKECLDKRLMWVGILNMPATFLQSFRFKGPLFLSAGLKRLSFFQLVLLSDRTPLGFPQRNGVKNNPQKESWTRPCPPWNYFIDPENMPFYTKRKGSFFLFHHFFPGGKRLALWSLLYNIPGQQLDLRQDSNEILREIFSWSSNYLLIALPKWSLRE